MCWSTKFKYSLLYVSYFATFISFTISCSMNNSSQKAACYFQTSTLHSSHFFHSFFQKQNNYGIFFIFTYNLQSLLSRFERLYKSFLFIVTLTKLFDTFFALFSFCLIFSFSDFSAFLLLFVCGFFIVLYLHNFNEKHFFIV